MAIEHDFQDINKVLRLIEEVQDSEQDQRELVQEQKIFCIEKDGQWDQRLKEMMKGRYRGTFDQVSPIIDQISGEMDEAQFAIKVSPAGGDATEDTAETYAGIIRNIENISNAPTLYAATGKSMVMAGLDGIEIVQEFLDANTFDQDLIFKPVSDWDNSVWFDLAAVQPDMSDAKWAIKLRMLPAADYKKQFPKGSGVSVGTNVIDGGIDEKTYDSVTVGKIYYKKPVDIELVKMSDGSVYEKEKVAKVLDEMAQAGITIADERTRKSWRVWTRILDGIDFLTEEEETVFSYIPLVPTMGNFSILKGVRKYFGKTMKLMDPQRGLNFAQSAEVEEVALSPNDAIWMTKEQGAGEDYSQMNIDKKAVRFYNHQDMQPMPGKMGGKMGNPGLQAAVASFSGLLQKTGNMDDPSMGQNPGLQSGVAISQIVQQSNNGNVGWFKSQETMICQLYRICVDAIPRVYSGTRQQRIMGEDGVGKTVMINKTILDQQSGQFVEVNDLSKGTYDTTCSMGAAFKNQQQATARAITDLASTDPAVMEMGRDILIKNQDSPGMDILHKRFRALGIANGTILRSEYTEEEEQQAQQAEQQAAQQEQQPDPNMLIAQAEMQKAQAEMTNAQNKQVEIQGNQQIKGQELQLSVAELQLRQQEFDRQSSDKFNVDAAKIQQGQAKLDLQAQNQQFQQQLALMKQRMDEMSAAVKDMKTIREAAGVDVIMGPGIVDNFKTQSDIVSEEQKDNE